jgi:hypothetical protein
MPKIEKEVKFLTNDGCFRSYLYKRKRRRHHNVAAPKRKNKQLYTS